MSDKDVYGEIRHIIDNFKNSKMLPLYLSKCIDEANLDYTQTNEVVYYIVKKLQGIKWPVFNPSSHTGGYGALSSIFGEHGFNLNFYIDYSVIDGSFENFTTEIKEKKYTPYEDIVSESFDKMILMFSKFPRISVKLKDEAYYEERNQDICIELKLDLFEALFPNNSGEHLGFNNYYDMISFFEKNLCALGDNEIKLFINFSKMIPPTNIDTNSPFFDLYFSYFYNYEDCFLSDYSYFSSAKHIRDSIIVDKYGHSSYKILSLKDLLSYCFSLLARRYSLMDLSTLKQPGNETVLVFNENSQMPLIYETSMIPRYGFTRYAQGVR